MVNNNDGTAGAGSPVNKGDLIQEIVTLRQQLNEPEKRLPQVFLTDATAEAAQTSLAEQGGRIAILTDEGNFFDIVSGMYTGGKQNADVFLQGHSGGDLRVKRQQREVILPQIAVSIGLAIQPAVLSEQSDTDRRKNRGKGLLARFLYCLPKSNIGSRDVRRSTPIPVGVKNGYAEVIKTLLSFEPMINRQGHAAPLTVTLSADALEAWHAFADYIEKNQGEGCKFDRLQDFTGKLPGAALRIAGICHLAEQASKDTLSASSSSSSDEINRNVINCETIEPVLDLCDKLIIHAQAALDLLGDDATIADAKYCLKWITANAKLDEKGAYFIRQNDLHTTARFKNSKLERLTKALDILRERNVTSGQQKLPTKKPTYIYYVNPLLFARQADGVA